MPKKEQVQSHDILIIGAGTAGLRAALELAEHHNIGIVAKTHPLRSPSATTTQGLAAATQSKDSWTQHVKDTVSAAAGLADQDAAQILCQEAPQQIEELENFGAILQRTKEAKLHARKQGAHTHARVHYTPDATGHMVVHTLYQQLTREKLKLYNEHMATKLVVEDNQIKGVIVLDIATGKLFGIAAKAVILTTGGCGQMYGTTTNAHSATGDGMALAYREGATLKDMEFMQFHPLTLAKSHQALPLAVLNHGAILINWRNQPFLKRYVDKNNGKLSQDLLAYAVDQEEKISKKYAKLDVRHVALQNFPNFKRLLQIYDLDPQKHTIPITTAQHRALGGITTTSEGQTDIDGLFAAGQCACISASGANALIGNSRIETLVFAKKAAESAKEYVKHKKGLGTQEYIALRIALRDNKEIMDGWLNNKAGPQQSEIRKELKKIMNQAARLTRSAKTLEAAQEKVQELQEQYKEMTLVDKEKSYNTELVDAFTLGCLLDVAQATLAASLAREESRGCHFRKDHKQTKDKEFKKHILVKRKTGVPELLSQSVRTTGSLL